MISRQHQVRLSAVWAAYGDALGFVTELADSGRVKHRSGQTRIERTIDWKRKVGGRPGGFTTFPAGTYSDDTQLRLATSRAIRRDGSFDVAAFAKVELPAWTSYALGAGIGSREAASNLARSSAAWYSNFFENKRSSYFHGGGNGAAMRVQPHVWAAKDLSATDQILRDVVRNAIVTHGHPRGILGACFHALTLASAMREGQVPNGHTLWAILDDLSRLHEVIEGDRDLRTFWLGQWLDHFDSGLNETFGRVIQEMRDDLNILLKVDHKSASNRYELGVEAVQAFDSTSRGSGTKTALLAAFAADIYRDQGPERALVDVINTLGSDTDTIATMAGALLGAVSATNCEHDLQDRGYIEAEADRLAKVASGEQCKSFEYPDLRSWKPARVAADAIHAFEGELFLGGIGPVRPMEREAVPDGSGFMLSWFELPFAQTILARTRIDPLTAEPDKSIERRTAYEVSANAAKAAARLPDLFAGGTSRQAAPEPAAKKPRELALNGQLQEVISSGFDKLLIGELLLSQAEGDREDYVERSIALAANIITAYAARLRRRRD